MNPKTKIIFQFLVLAALFTGTFAALCRIDWTGFFHIDEVSRKTEEKLGDLYWNLIKSSNREIKSVQVKKPLEILFNHLIDQNDLQEYGIKLHLVENEQVNAFALPHGHLVVFSGLVENCRNEAELMGVLGHEIAHITRNHVMKKLLKEVGLNVLISATTGSGGPVIIQETLKTLSSTAYDRNLESEADRYSVKYMLKAESDPRDFAAFLLRMSENEKDMPRQFFWVSTHPESEKRAAEIKEIIKDRETVSRPVLPDAEWQKLKESIEKVLL